MVYGGAIASGAIAGASVTLFGYTFEPGLAGLPRDRGRRHGRLPDRLRDRLGDRHPRRAAVSRAARALASPRRGEARPRRGLVRSGRTGPCCSAASRRSCGRSSRSRPASSRRRSAATRLTLIGSAIWCFVFAGIGWAAGASWESFHHAFRYADVVVAVAIVAVAAWLGWRFLRKRRSAAYDADEPGARRVARTALFPASAA